MADDAAPFRLELNGKVGRLTLARPASRNAMDAAFWRELPRQVRALDAQGACRCLVIAAEGPHFTSGMDLSVFARPGALGVAPHGGDRATAMEAFRHLVAGLQASFTALERARFPVLAAVQGGCIGAGVDLVSACDVRYAAADAFFQVQEINIAMTADVGTFPRLARLMAEGAVRELAYTGRRLPAEEAHRLGLVTAVLPDAPAVLAHAMEAAREIAAKAPVAIAGSKVMLNYARDHATADALDYVAVWQTGMLSAEHMREAMTARAQGRAPEFPDLAPLRDGL